MAGSRKTVQYTADSGANYCIMVDESNIEMIMGAQVPANGSYPKPPEGTKPRFVRVEDQTGKIKRKIPVLTLARYTALTGATALTLPLGDIDATVAVRVRTKHGEENTFIPRDYDTGKDDGDTD
jgi:hypothetical protein